MGRTTFGPLRALCTVDPRGRLLNFFGAAKSAGAREKNPRSQKSPAGPRAKNAGQPVHLPHTPSAAILSWEEYFRRSWKKLFFWLRVLSVCSYRTRQFEAITRHVFSQMLGVIWQKRKKERSLRRAPQAGRTPSNALTHQTPWRKRPRPSPSRPRSTSCSRSSSTPSTRTRRSSFVS